MEKAENRYACAACGRSYKSESTPDKCAVCGAPSGAAPSGSGAADRNADALTAKFKLAASRAKGFF